jgi:Uma2 family endonuclease
MTGQTATSNNLKIAAKLSLSEYLRLEAASTERHEFIDGRLLLMAGESRRHGRIVNNIVKVLDDAALAKACELQAVSIKLRTEHSRIRYPDVVVTCHPGNESHVVSNPCFLAEVLSDSAKREDRGRKLEEYLAIASLQRYIIVSQQQPKVMLYWRDGENWKVSQLGPDDTIDIPCLETSLSVADIYRHLEFAPKK